MRIRRIQSNELNSLLDLYAHLHADDDPRPEQEVLDAVWQEALANPRCRYFGAYEDDRLIAGCTILVIPNLTRACRPYGVIENVVTHAEFRNKGHGKAVLAHALAFAWYKVMLLTGRKDEATMRFYEGAVSIAMESRRSLPNQRPKPFFKRTPKCWPPHISNGRPPICRACPHQYRKPCCSILAAFSLTSTSVAL